MNMQLFNTLLMESGKSALSITGLAMTGLPRYINTMLPSQNIVLIGLKSGVFYTISLDVSNYLFSKMDPSQSKIMSMDLMGLLDDVFYLGTVSSLASLVKVDDMLEDTLRSTIPLSNEMISNLTEGILVASSNVGRWVVDATFPKSHPVTYLTHWGNAIFA